MNISFNMPVGMSVMNRNRNILLYFKRKLNEKAFSTISIYLTLVATHVSVSGVTEIIKMFSIVTNPEFPRCRISSNCISIRNTAYPIRSPLKILIGVHIYDVVKQKVLMLVSVRCTPLFSMTN